MGFLIPSALALAALAIPIIIFYMLKLRRQPARVSSLMLWRQVLQDRQANAPWQRLRRNLLLLLQLLILALLVMALARPYFTVQASVKGNVVLLLDASASMQAADAAPTRFAAAKEAAEDLIDRLDPDDAVTLIAVDSTPRILAAAADHDALSRALAAARPGAGPADWQAALTLASANAAALPEATVVIISDGGIALEDEAALSSPDASVSETSPDNGAGPAPTSQESEAVETAVDLSHLPVPIQFIPIGDSAANQGLVALSLRDGRDGPELFLRASNAAPEPARRLVEVRVDGRLFDAHWLDLPARSGASLTLSGLPLDARRVQARLDGDDALALDDRAWAVRSAAPGRILLVGPGNLFLERALALLPGVTIHRAGPDQPLPETAFDLIIFDRTLPAETDAESLTGGNLFFIAPPASTPHFEVAGVVTQTRIARLRQDDPLLAYVKLNNLQVARARAVEPPPWARTLVEARGGPLLLAGQSGKQRLAILTFDLHQSDLPLQIDFPILMANLARWLLPGDNLSQGRTLAANQSFELPTAASADAFIIETPAGEALTIPSNQAFFNETNVLGVYRVLAAEPGREEPVPLTEFTVNLLSEAESDIRPRMVESSGGAAASTGQQFAGRWEWWWILVAAGLSLLLVEWWVYWRGEVR